MSTYQDWCKMIATIVVVFGKDIYLYLAIHTFGQDMYEKKNDLITRHPKSFIYYPIVFLLRLFFLIFPTFLYWVFMFFSFASGLFYIEGFFVYFLFLHSVVFISIHFVYFPLFFSFFLISHACHTLLVLFQYKTEKMT